MKVGGVVISLSKAIPVSKIDALIASLDLSWDVEEEIKQDFIERLEGLEEESEEMIPLSAVEALISKLESQQKEIGPTLQRLYKIEILEEIKKQGAPK